jgi:transposase
VKIGEETSEQLEYVPSSLHVIVHARFRYACRACQEHVAVADKPPQPIDKGLPGPGLLAQTITSKYNDHLPLYRLEDIFARHGVELSRATLCGWMASSAELLTPLYDLMVKRVLLSSVIHTDDTKVSVLDPTLPRTRTGRFWVYIGDVDSPYAVYDYTPRRTRDGPERFLKEFRGYLQADAFSGYDRICAGPHVKEVACWATYGGSSSRRAPRRRCRRTRPWRGFGNSTRSSTPPRTFRPRSGTPCASGIRSRCFWRSGSG